VVAVAGNLERASSLERGLAAACVVGDSEAQAHSGLGATQEREPPKREGGRGGEIRPSHTGGKALGREKPKRGSAGDRC
jgi:hypothetical protein